ncbi:hypothetical protein GCM10010381_60060 [Streptomyces xantholiticus]|nr:hypothetical protein GCM10010381_60060 [Streptomyces xantholiticus]
MRVDPEAGPQHRPLAVGHAESDRPTLPQRPRSREESDRSPALPQHGHPRLRPYPADGEGDSGSMNGFAGPSPCARSSRQVSV